MSEQIDRILWLENDDHLVVAYSGREPDRIVSDRLVATRLAEDAGLVPVPAPPGTACWARRRSTNATRVGVGGGSG